MLHHDKEVFQQVILFASEELGIEPGIIEKDYYVTAFLKLLVEMQPQIIFKGGTSLSKCYHLIHRFSEDIDLNLEYDKRPTQGQRRQLKENIVATIDAFGFTLTNPDEVRSRRDYNKYVVDFPSVFEYSKLKQHLIVETSVFLRAFPAIKMTATSLIYDYLDKENRMDLISQYSLEPFVLNVQDVRRTFVDKLFAVGDYYLNGNITEHSRHIYDLYKLYDAVKINDDLKELFATVKKERREHSACLSAQDDVDLRDLLDTVISEAAYKADYETITLGLLYEKVPYEIAIGVLQKVLDSGLLDTPL